VRDIRRMESEIETKKHFTCQGKRFYFYSLSNRITLLVEDAWEMRGLTFEHE